MATILQEIRSARVAVRKRYLALTERVLDKDGISGDEFLALLEFARTECHISLRAIAAASGVVESTVSNWLTKPQPPALERRFDILLGIAELVERDMKKLRRRRRKPPASA
jgi:hypothetical protein